MNEANISQLMRECTYRGVFILGYCAGLLDISLSIASDALLGGNTAVLSISWWVWGFTAINAAGVLWTGHRSRRLKLRLLGK